MSFSRMCPMAITALHSHPFGCLHHRELPAAGMFVWRGCGSLRKLESPCLHYQRLNSSPRPCPVAPSLFPPQCPSSPLFQFPSLSSYPALIPGPAPGRDSAAPRPPIGRWPRARARRRGRWRRAIGSGGCDVTARRRGGSVTQHVAALSQHRRPIKPRRPRPS